MLALLALSTLARAEDLAVSSNVRGASILINGSDTGFRTPAVISGLSPGTVQVTVQDQCRAGVAQVEIAAGKSGRVTVEAQEQLATLTVQVTPAQAVVDVNNGNVKLSPNIPVGLPCGTYELTAELQGYQAVSYSLELVGGQKLDLPITLDKLGMSTVEIAVEPRSASILFDGKEVGKDAVSMPAVYEGLHTIGASQKGYTDAEAPIAVGDGDAMVFKIKLSRGDQSEVEGVGGAGKRALAEGAKQKAKSEPKIAEDEGPLRDEVLPDDEPEPEQEPEPEPDTVEDVPEEDEEPGDDTLDEEPEEDADLAPQSFSERHSAGESKATTKASSSKSSARVESRNPKAGLDIAGGTLVALGAVVGGVGGGYLYVQTGTYYSEWLGLDAAVADAPDARARQRAEAEADDYFASTVAPSANLFYGTLVAGGVLGATGLILILVDEAGTPVVMPTPGGGIVGWSGHF